MNLNETAKLVHELAVLNGYWPEGRLVADVLCNIHVQWCKAFDEYNAGHSLVWHACVVDGTIMPKPCEAFDDCQYKQGGRYAQICDCYSKKNRGIAGELIDGFICVLDAAAAWHIKLPQDAMNHMDNLQKEIEALPLPSIVMMLHQRTSELWHSDIVTDPKHYIYKVADILCIVWIWLAGQGLHPASLLSDKIDYNKGRANEGKKKQR